MTELGADAPLIVADVREVDGGAEVDGEAEVLAAAVVVGAGGEARGEDSFFEQEDVDAHAAEDITIALRNDKEAG